MPDNANAGSAVTLTVNGSSFNSNAVVNWNGMAQPTMYVTGSQLTASLSAATLSMAGTFTVTVTNPGTTGYGGTSSETSNAMTFTVK